MPHQGIHSVTVPGAVRGWGEMQAHFGRLCLEHAVSRRDCFTRPKLPNFENVHTNAESVRAFLPGN